MARSKYTDNIPWKVLEEHLLTLRKDWFLKMLDAEGLQEVGKAQGRAGAYHEMLNLRETLTLNEEAG